MPPEVERPLVKFALFAYNQQRFVRKAIAGAFSQTCKPLELILSGDSSTDRTFEIMQEIANDVLSLSMGPHLSEFGVDRVVAVIAEHARRPVSAP